MGFALPAFTASFYFDRYQYDNISGPGRDAVKIVGPAGSLGAGVGVGTDSGFALGTMVVGRFGSDIIQDQSNNTFGSVGARVGATALGCVTLGVETGYRWNSLAEDHPYIGADISGGLYTIGPFIGVALDPNTHYAFWDNSSVYFGIKIGG